MAKYKNNYGEVLGKCPICTINLWESSKGKPVIWPCNITNCPYEDVEDQKKLTKDAFSLIGSGLAQIL